MTEIRRSRECGHPPKNAFVQAIAIALESGKANPENFSEDVIWERDAKVRVTGRSARARALMARVAPAALTAIRWISGRSFQLAQCRRRQAEPGQNPAAGTAVWRTSKKFFCDVGTRFTRPS